MNEFENENLDDYESISTFESFDSLFNDNNQKNTFLDQVVLSIDRTDISPEKSFNGNNKKNKYYKCCKCCKCRKCTCNIQSFLNRLSDLVMLLVVIFDCIFYLVSNILIICTFVVSYYSIIIMNYVFFISSIISYSMAPINKAMSGDSLNFSLSVVQVILASPLISFYIVYILKSVKNLGEFMEDFTGFLKDFLIMVLLRYKNYFRTIFSDFFQIKYERVFSSNDILDIFFDFLISLFCLLFYGLLFYVSFFRDKWIVLLGFICYIINTLQIFAIVFPSYVYFIQILYNGIPKKFKYIYQLRNIYKNLYKQKKILKSNESDSDDSESNSEDSESEYSKSKSKRSKSKEKEKSVDESNIENNNKKSKFQQYLSKLKKLAEEEEDKDEEKIIDDEFIDQLPDDDKQLKKIFIKIRKTLYHLIFADKYLSLYYFSTEIAFDPHKQIRRIIVMYIFLFFNLGIISYDIYQLVNDYSDYLLASIIVRFILIPLFSFYNICTVMFHKAKDKTIRYSNYASIAITIIISFIIIFGLLYIEIYKKRYRINNLEYFPPLSNYTIANEKMILHPVCDYKIFDISAFDAFGYALGGFDVRRNITIFNNQMKIFFGENYSNRISYEIYELDKYFYFMKFFDSSINTTIYAFKGYNSGPEIAFQFELFASKYIIPFFEDNTPFLENINDFWLSFYTDFLHAFGLRFFENRNLIFKYVKSIREIYEKENYSEKENVIFTGINTGGVIAKVVGTLLYRKSIAFISFPMKLDFVEHLFHYSSTFMSYVTNIFNVDGIFSHLDSDHTINIGIDTPLFHESKFCTSGLCEKFSRFDNIYRTFCTMSETCGRGNQFNLLLFQYNW